MKEVWKDVPGYEGLYQASIYGYVKSVDRVVPKGKKHVLTPIRGRVISPWIDRTGYLKVEMFKNGKCHKEKLHQIIARTFIPNPQNKETVNHKDENPLNNTVQNLEWMTNKENVNYGTRIQRDREEFGTRVKRIAPNKNEDFYFTLHDAEAKTGIPRQSISYAIKHHTLLKGYRWEVI